MLFSNDQDTTCPSRYYFDEQLQSCAHMLFPITIQTLIGSMLIMLIAGLSSIAGLGGGGPSLVVFIMFFDYIPKDANMVVFTSIFGATLGNCTNQMRKAHNGEPVVQYKFAFVSLPVMFLGSYFGVYLNKLLPSLAICSIIVYQSVQSLPKIYRRFIESYQLQTTQNQQHRQRKITKKNKKLPLPDIQMAHIDKISYQNNQQAQKPHKRQDSDSDSTISAASSALIKQEVINPFLIPENNQIFLNILVLISMFTGLMLIRGTEKVPSLIGIESCSFAYWFVLMLSLLAVGAFGWRNLKTLEIWMAQKQDLTQPLAQESATSEKSIGKYNNEIIYYSIMAGIFSGFGLGGGLFLVPMYRCLGCSPLQATATTSFTILTTSFINCMQGMFLGLITLSDFAYFLMIAGGGSFVISIILSGYLRKINRLSYVQGLLFALLVLASINIPLSLLAKYINSGYNGSLILSFGSLC